MSDGYVVTGRVWSARRPDAHRGFLYFHGIQSHGGWFEWSAALLAETGLPVVLPDRRGSGRNERERGDTPSLARWRADVDELCNWMTRGLSVQSFRLIGVSWGAKLAVDLAVRRADQVEDVLLIAPGLFPAVDIGAWRRVRIGTALLREPAARFAIPLNDPGLFTDDPEGQAFIRNDPLRLDEATARFFYHSYALDRVLARLRPGALRTPVTVVLADRDRIIRNQATATWLKRIAGGGLRVVDLHGSHTLEFEADPAPFEAALRNWADPNGPRAKSAAPC